MHLRNEPSASPSDGRREPPRRRSGVFAFLARLGFGFAVLAVVAYFVDIRESLKALTVMNPGLVLMGLACVVVSRFLMGLKWWLLLGGPEATVSYPAVLRALLLSNFHGLLFPNTLAIDALRVALLRHHPQGVTHMAGTVLADRMVNIVVTASVALFGVSLLTMLPDGPRVETPVLYGSVGAALAVLAAVAALRSRRMFEVGIRLSRSFLSKGPLHRPLTRIIGAVNSMHLSMAMLLNQPALLVRAAAIAAAVVACRIGFVYFLFLAIGFPVAYLAVVAIFPIVTLIALLPISLMGFGVKDGAFVVFFGAAGVPASVALAVSFATYVVVIGCSLGLGLLATLIGPPLPQARESSGQG